MITSENQHDITFIPSGRGKAQHPSNPQYPHGVDIDGSLPGEDFCVVLLPYPAPECGLFTIACDRCKFTVAVTAAGRADDPRSVAMPCRHIEDVK